MKWTSLLPAGPSPAVNGFGAPSLLCSYWLVHWFAFGLRRVEQMVARPPGIGRHRGKAGQLLGQAITSLKPRAYLEVTGLIWLSKVKPFPRFPGAGLLQSPVLGTQYRGAAGRVKDKRHVFGQMNTIFGLVQSGPLLGNTRRVVG